jgi:hypothetical protein
MNFRTRRRTARAAAPRRSALALAVLCASVLALLLAAAPALAKVEPALTIDPNPTGFYTTAEVSGTVNPEGTPCCGVSWVFEYSTEPANPSSWVQSNVSGGLSPEVEVTTPQPAVGTMEGLKPDTTYYVRLDSYEYPEPEGVLTGAPYPSFTTKHVNLPKATLNEITAITKSTAHFSGTAETNAPAGPLSPAEKAAYKTEWKVECSPECTALPGGSGAVEGDASSQAISLDPFRLETNTFYEVTLTATNAAGTTIATRSFQTPFIPPDVTATPGGSAGKGSFNIGGLVTPYNSKISNCHFAYGPTTEYVYSAPCSPDPVGRNMVESLTLGTTTNGEGDSSEFKIAFRGQTTQSMVVGAPASVLEGELKALSAIGPEGVSRVEHEFGFFTSVYTVEFGGPLASMNVSPLRALTGTETINSPGGNFAGTVVQGGNNTPVLVEAHLSGLTPGATYHYQVFATNGLGTVGSGDQTFVSPLAANEAACPNEAERVENSSTALPECRAYELATSAFKASSNAALFAFTNEGTVGYETKAPNVANSGEAFLNNFYIARRLESGWETVPNLNGPLGSIYAPPNSFEGSILPPAHFAQNLLSAIYYIPKQFEKTELELFLRRQDGSFVRIGEGNPDPRGFDQWVGGNADLSRTVWNGTAGWGPGVYEFVGTGNDQPNYRVDLDDAGNPISECINGTSAGAAQGLSVSEDANVVYMLVSGGEGCPGGIGPPADEIWARVNRTSSYDATASHCTRTSTDPGGACLPLGNPSSSEPAVHFEGATSDGSRIYFATGEQLVNEDTNKTKDLYTYSLPTASNPGPSLIDITGSSPEAKLQGVLGMAKEGDVSRVYFVAEGTVLAHNQNALEETAVASDLNLYVWQQDASHPEGETKFIGRLRGNQTNDVYRTETTPDGRYLVFTTVSPMVPTDTDNALDVYRYDAVTGELIRVSTDASGVGGNTDGLDAEISPRGVSNNGQEVVFTTSEALSANDGNGAPDVYIWRGGHTSLISTGSVGGGASVGYIDGSGQNVYFTSSQELTADDIDNVSDVYDARIDGGFSFAERAPCSGEGCQPSLPGGPAAPAPATEGAEGAGNHQLGTVSVKALSSSEQEKLGAGAQVGLKVKVSGPGKISVRGSARVGSRQKQVLASKSTAVQAGDVNVPISLTQAAQAQLRSARSLKIRLTVSFADAVPSASTLTLKAPQARPGNSKRKGG